MRRLVSFTTAVLVAMSGLTVAATGASAGPAPAECRTGVTVSAGKSPATVSVSDSTTLTHVPVTVSISGTSLALASADPAVTLLDARWCVKSRGNVIPGGGLVGENTATDGKGAILDIASLVVIDVATAPVQPPSDPWPTLIGQCFNGNENFTDPAAGNVQYWVDTMYVGTADSPNNLMQFDSLNGTCSGTTSWPAQWIQAADQEAADAVCGSLYANHFAVAANIRVAGAPADAWYCSVSSSVG